MKLARNVRDSLSSSWLTMSSRTLGVAVAVSADHRDAGLGVAQGLQVAVVGPEVVAPLRYAVGLVDGQQADIKRPEERGEPRGRQPFGRNVEDLESAPHGLRPHPARLCGCQRAVQELRRDAVGLQAVYLVLHERDQRRYDDGDAVHCERRKLVAKRLTAARGHEHQPVSPGQHVGDYLLLQRQEGVESEVCLEQAS